MHARTALVVPALLAAISLVAPGIAAAQQSEFAGSWVLNPDESDDAQEKMQQAQRRSSEGGPMRRDRTRGRGGRGAGGGPGSAGMSAEAQTSNRVANQRIMRPARLMTIVLTDSTVTIGQGDLLPWIFPTDKSKRDFQDGIEVTGRWDGDKLSLQTDTEGGLRIRETYELKEDGEELRVSIVFENNRTGLRVRFRRVYNAQQAMESSYLVDTTP